MPPVEAPELVARLPVDAVKPYAEADAKARIERAIADRAKAIGRKCAGLRWRRWWSEREQSWLIEGIGELRRWS